MRFQDNVLTTLSSDITSLAITLDVNAPSGPYKAPVDPAGGLASLTLVDSLVAPTKIETITYTGRTGTGPYTLTGVTRGTPAFDWTAGSRVFQAIRSSDILSEALADKAIPVDADVVGVLDSATQFVLKKLTLSNLRVYIGKLLPLKTYTEEIATPAISAGVLAIDLAVARVFSVAHNANITDFQITNCPAGVAVSFTLVLTQDATGGRTLTLPASCVPANGTAPTLSTTAGKGNELTFRTYDGGTKWLYSLAGSGF